MAENQSDAMNRRDLFILSDFHLGEGRMDGLRYVPTEDFFYDDQFASFIEYLILEYNDNPDNVSLVLNGDIFDFVTVTSVPDADEASKRGFSVSSLEEKFGLNATEAKSVYKLDLIVRGHINFFKAVAKFIAFGGHVEIIRGNHDIELYFKGVQNRLLFHLEHLAEKNLENRVKIHQVYYNEKGRVHIEHGHQYDSANSDRYPLKPLFSRPENDNLKNTEQTIDYPMGSIFVKYFYNRVRLFDPYSPRLVSFEQYIDFFRRYNVFDVFRVYKEHYPYFLAAFGPNTHVKSVNPSKDEHENLNEAQRKIAHKDGLLDKFYKWNALKLFPEKLNRLTIAKQAMKPLVRRGMWFFMLGFSLIFVWMLIFGFLQEIPVNSFTAAFLTSVFAASSIVGGVWLWGHLRKRLRFSGHDREKIIIESAKALGELFDAPIVVMGHSHKVDLRTVDSKGTIYANSGTWTHTANPWSRIISDARKMTFVKISGNTPELARWNSNSRSVESVPLFTIDDKKIAKPFVSDEISVLNDGENSIIPGIFDDIPPMEHFDEFENKGD